MIVVTGAGRIIKNLDENGVIAEFKNAQKTGDRFCSVVGAYSEGFEPEDLMRKANYRISASEAECHASLSRMMSKNGRKGGQSKSPKKQAASRENGKLGGRPRKQV